MTTARPTVYSIHGLVVESDVVLDSVVAGPDHAQNGGQGLRYRVMLGEERECPHSPPAGRLVYTSKNLPGFWVSEDPAHVERWTGRFADHLDFSLDRSRRLVTCHPAPELDREMISILLGGAVLAFVLAVEGHLALHASAVVVRERALAVAGPSGSGKSTIAAIMCGAGAALLTDDALRVDVSGSGVTCHPGTMTIRLREDAAPVADGVVDAEVGETADGRTGLVPPRVARGPAPLAAVLLARPAHGAQQLAVRRLGGVDSVRELLSHPRFLWSFRADGGTKQLELTADLASTAPVYEATIPWGPPFDPNLAEDIATALGL